MSSVIADETGLNMCLGSRTLRIEAWGADVIRVRETFNPRFAEAPSALVSDRAATAEVSTTSCGGRLRSGALSVDVSSEGRLVFQRDGETEALLQEFDAAKRLPHLWPPGRDFRSVAPQLYHVEASFAAHEGEHFYGLGQHRHGMLDQKGAVIGLVQRNAEVSIPFLVSSRGYGFLWNNAAEGRVELGRERTRWVAEATRQLDYLVIGPARSDRDAGVARGSGESIYASIMRRYAELTGYAPDMPEWASGFWQSKLRYETQQELLEVAREYKRRRLPLSVIVVDFFHWVRMGDWDFERDRWPDPEAMIRELHQMDVRVMVSVWPTLNPNSENCRIMEDRGLLVEADSGNNLLMRFIDTHDTEPVHLAWYDATNPHARSFIWQQCRQNYRDIGVDLFWLDACEGPTSTSEHRPVRLHAGTGLEVNNSYPLQHARAFYDGMRAEHDGPVLNLCRSAWAGSQRYGAAVWSGDIHSDWDTFRTQIAAGLNMAMSGIPWWTTDIGGFEQGNVEDPDFRELVVRWFEFAVFCPLFRLHGNRQPRPASHRFGGAPNEVWSFGQQAYEVIRGLLFLRERLRPYVHEQMRVAAETGIPPLRPIFFDHPGDENTYGLTDQFLFGPDIIVAPVTHAGARSRSVYVPANGRWMNGWTDESLPPGASVEVDAPLGRPPVLLAEGERIPLRS